MQGDVLARAGELTSLHCCRTLCIDICGLIMYVPRCIIVLSGEPSTLHLNGWLLTEDGLERVDRSEVPEEQLQRGHTQMRHALPIAAISDLPLHFISPASDIPKTTGRCVCHLRYNVLHSRYRSNSITAIPSPGTPSADNMR
jgi:hypothetical protein